MRLRQSADRGMLRRVATGGAGSWFGRGAVAIALLCSAGCATVHAQQLTPDELGELARREIEDPLPLWPIDLGDGGRAQAEAVVKPVSRPAEGGELVGLGLGTESPLTCRVISGPIEGGALIAARVAEAAERSEVRSVEASAVEPAGGAAVLFVEVTYLSRDGKSVGSLKLAVAPGARRSFACEHDEVGYSRTFRRVVVQLVASARKPGEDPPAFFDALEAKLDGQISGLQTRHQERQGGTSVFTTTTIDLQPLGDGRVRAVDTLRSEASDKFGLVWLHRTRVTIDGKTDLDLTAQRRDGSESEFTVEGTVHGQPVHAAMKAELGLTSMPLLASRVRSELVRGHAPGLQAFTYEPTESPTQPVSTFYRVEGGLIVDGRSNLKASSDGAGIFQSWTMRTGVSNRSASRVSMHGALAEPAGQ